MLWGLVLSQLEGKSPLRDCANIFMCPQHEKYMATYTQIPRLLLMIHRFWADSWLHSSGSSMAPQTSEEMLRYLIVRKTYLLYVSKDREKDISNYNEVVLWHEQLLNSTVLFKSICHNLTPTKMLKKQSSWLNHTHYLPVIPSVSIKLMWKLKKHMLRLFYLLSWSMMGSPLCFQDDLLAVPWFDRLSAK